MEREKGREEDLKGGKEKPLKGVFVWLERERERVEEMGFWRERASVNKRWEKGVPENIREVRGVKL